MALFIYSLNWDRIASCRLRDALGGDTRNECFWLKNHYISLFFAPKTTVWPSLGRISVEILMATTCSRQIFRWRRHRRLHFVLSSKLFYSIEVLHIHITCLHVYIVYIYLHLLPRTPDCVMPEARITEFFGETQTDGRSARISGGSLVFHGIGVLHAKGSLEVASPQPLQ